jgi:DNA-directed RNA polymerase subunit RPC12/RpoP
MYQEKITCIHCGSSFDKITDDFPVIECETGTIIVLDYHCPHCKKSLNGYERIEVAE